MSGALFFRALSGVGLINRLSVMIFHRVHASPDDLFPTEPDAVAFESHMRWLRDCFNILPLA
ncbi:MAG TPA: hypothetical protein VJM53_06370, partial [Burkholderiales bacterium]|nr:hypothetical protein [Burkholderiales bacterium]